MKLIISYQIIFTIFLFILEFYDYRHRFIIHYIKWIISILLFNIILPGIICIVVIVLWNFNIGTLNILTYTLLVPYLLSLFFISSSFIYFYFKPIFNNITIIKIILFMIIYIIGYLCISYGVKEITKESFHYLSHYRLIGSIILIFAVIIKFITYYDKYYQYLYNKKLRITEYYPEYIYMHVLLKTSKFKFYKLKISFISNIIGAFGSYSILFFIWIEQLKILKNFLRNSKILENGSNIIFVGSALIISVFISLIVFFMSKGIKNLVFHYYNYYLGENIK